MANEITTNIETYTTSESIQEQTKIATALLQGKNLPSEIISGNPTLANILSNSTPQYSNLGIGTESIQQVSQGEIVTLNQEDRIKVIDTLLRAINLNNYTWSALTSTKPNYSDIGELEVRRLAESLYSETNVVIIGNLVQVVCPNNRSYSLLNYRLRQGKTKGMFLPFPMNYQEGKGITFSENLLLNLVNESTEFTERGLQRHDTKRHEKWHAFDYIRLSVLDKKEVITEQKYFPLNTMQVRQSLNTLNNELPTEFNRYMFGDGLNNTGTNEEIDRRISVLQVELPAFIAGFIREEDSASLIDSREETTLVDKLIESYLLGGLVDFDSLRWICEQDSEGKYVVKPDLISYPILNPIARIGETPQSETDFLDYYTERLGWSMRRKFKEGKDTELFTEYQKVIDLFFNNADSPFVKVRTELNRAIAAYKERSISVGSYQALVEMSLLPYNRWSAYSRMKNS